MIKEKARGLVEAAGLSIGSGRWQKAGEGCYDARAARRTVGAGGATLATLARAAMRALVEKQRSSAVSTRASIAGAVSRITSETSEMIRNFARSSIRFSRNDRLLDLARKVRLFKTSATS